MGSKIFLFFGFWLLSINLLVLWVLDVYEFEELKVIWGKYNYKVLILVFYFIVDFFYDLKNVILGELVFGLYIF